jgi:hypothetical protein
MMKLRSKYDCNAGHQAWAAKKRAEAEAKFGSMEEAQRASARARALAYYHRNKSKIKPVAAAKARRLNRVRGSHPMRRTAPRSMSERIRAVSAGPRRLSKMLFDALQLEAAQSAMRAHAEWIDALDSDDGVLYPLGE